MAQKIEYVVPPERIETWQKAYDAGRMSLDILKKFREGGRPNADAELRVEAGLENVRRLANAFNVELKE